MKQLQSILGLLLLLVGSFVLYKVLPAYWADFKLGRLLEEQALNATYSAKTESAIAIDIAQKASEFDLPIAPEQITVQRTSSGLNITAEYSVHVEMPIYPMDLKFKTTSQNKDPMAR